MQMDQSILAWRTGQVSDNKKKRLGQQVDLAIPANHMIKLKDREKPNKCLDLARELSRYGTWTWQWYK